MIAKHVSMRSAGKSDFAGLVQYITDAQGKDHRLGQVRMTNCAAGSVRDAITEVLATQHTNRRRLPPQISPGAIHTARECGSLPPSVAGHHSNLHHPESQVLLGSQSWGVWVRESWPEKAGELAAIAPLLDRLGTEGGLKGALVSIDATATNAGIAREILDQGADWLEGPRRFAGEMRLPGLSCLVRAETTVEVRGAIRNETRYFASSKACCSKLVPTFELLEHAIS